jgi:hypothetical protein
MDLENLEKIPSKYDQEIFINRFTYELCHHQVVKDVDSWVMVLNLQRKQPLVHPYFYSNVMMMMLDE